MADGLANALLSSPIVSYDTSFEKIFCRITVLNFLLAIHNKIILPLL
jgi:hypothetical protein